MESIFLNDEEFKLYVPGYYVSEDGKVYSYKSQKLLKWLFRGKGAKKYPYVEVTINKVRKKVNVHRIVCETWIRKLNSHEQVNHIDDNKLNCNYKNLYIGSQKQNIADCFNNKHRVGNIIKMTLFDKETNEQISFCPASNFIEYSGHSNKSKSLKKFFSKDWFKKRYTIIEFKNIKNIKELNGVTTIPDEFKEVE